MNKKFYSNEIRKTLFEGASGHPSDEQNYGVGRLTRPFLFATIVSTASLLLFVAIATYALDKNSAKGSERVLAAVIGDLEMQISRLAFQNGYWDVAVTHMVTNLDRSWVENTYEDYLKQDLEIDALHVLDGLGKTKISVVNDRITTSDSLGKYGAAFQDLVARTRETPLNQPPEALSGIVGDRSGLHLVGSTLMTDYDENRDYSTDHVLVFAREITPKLLANLAQRYQLNDLSISSQAPGRWRAGQAIVNARGETLGYFVWIPEFAGLKLLPFLVLGIVLVLLCLFWTARVFFQRVTNTVSELELAKSEVEASRKLLAAQVLRDPLTSIGNRRLLDERLVQLSDDRNGNYALLYADLDGFKEVNDSYGHETGDEVLCYLAKKLVSLTSASDVVVRIGGDEFVVLFDSGERERVVSVANDLVETFHKPLNLNGAEYSLGVSVGISFSNSPSELLRQADIALYTAKHRGRGQVAIYSDKQSESFLYKVRHMQAV